LSPKPGGRLSERGIRQVAKEKDLHPRDGQGERSSKRNVGGRASSKKTVRVCGGRKFATIKKNLKKAATRGILGATEEALLRKIVVWLKKSQKFEG